MNVNKINLTPFEKFVWDNQHRNFKILAQELNRNEKDVWAALNRVTKKMNHWHETGTQLSN